MMKISNDHLKLLCENVLRHYYGNNRGGHIMTKQVEAL